MHQYADDEGILRANVVRLKKIADADGAGSSEAGKKYGIFLYMGGMVDRALEMASQQRDFTEEERAERKAEWMELIRRIIDEVFAEEGK